MVVTTYTQLYILIPGNSLGGVFTTSGVFCMAVGVAALRLTRISAVSFSLKVSSGDAYAGGDSGSFTSASWWVVCTVVFSVALATYSRVW